MDGHTKDGGQGEDDCPGVFYKGRKITQDHATRLQACFGEKVDDVHLCAAIIVLSMRPENTTARGAIDAAFAGRRDCILHGRQPAKRLIRETRRRLGYSSWLTDIAVDIFRFFRGLLVIVAMMIRQVFVSPR